MKKSAVLILVLIGFSSIVKAQSEESFSTNLGMGFHLIQNQQDFGIGLNLTSPYFVNEKIALRIKGNLLWNQHLDNNSNTTWSPYSSFSLGLIGVGGKIGDFIRLYGEGGIMVLLPSSEFSSKNSEFGGYGLFGFEFFMNSQSNYFIEIGGIGTGAIADKISGKPIYSNGLLISAGYRYVFK